MWQRGLQILLLILVNCSGLFAQSYVIVDSAKAKSGIESMVLTPDGRTLITGHLDGSLFVWDLQKMELIRELEVHNRRINSIIFAPDGSKFVTAGEDGTIAVILFPSFEVLKVFTDTTESYSFACFSPNDNSIYCGGHTRYRGMTAFTVTYNKPLGCLYRIDLLTGINERVFNNEKSADYGSWITDGNLDYEGLNIIFSKDHDVYFYNISKKKIKFKIRTNYLINNIKPTIDDLFLWGDAYLIKAIKQKNKYEITHSVKAGSGESFYGYSKMDLSGNSTMLLTGDDYNQVNIWNAEDLSRQQTLYGHDSIVRNFLFFKNDSLIITAGYDGKLFIWGFGQ